MIEPQDFYFPHPETSDKQGLLAIGGDLSPGRILQAYKSGIFPWFEPGNPVLWWSPNPRLVLKPQNFKMSRSLEKTLGKPWRYSINQAFASVIEACASTGDRQNETWITPEMISAYCRLHTMGYAHSVEVWLDEELAGGLYGISLGKAFFGESMFHRRRDASKLALHYLCQHLQEAEFHFIDCQIPTGHLQSLGAEIISRKAFLYALNLALKHPEQEGIFR